MRLPIGAAFMSVGIVAGWLTGLQALGRSGVQAVPEAGRWQQEVADPKSSSAIYAIGHYRYDGSLPPLRDMAVFIRSTDDDGNQMRTSCSYALDGPEPAARWWSLTAAPLAGGRPYSLTAAEAVISGDGRLVVAIAPHMMPGNRITVPEFGAMSVKLTMNEPYDKSPGSKPKLPAIKRVACE